MQENQYIQSISVKELKHKLDQGENIQILDVRQLDEYQFCNLKGIHIPLGDLAHRLNELDKKQPLAVLCHSGGRSARATFLLQNEGFEEVCNITGGITAWSHEIDPRVPLY